MSTPLSPAARQQVKRLLAQALALGETDRGTFLDGHCTDPAVRAEVDRLLAGQGEAGEFLVRPTLVPEAVAAPHESLLEGPGSVIGPYKLLQQIGEGGFGTVFMAEQEQPIRRRVALKILKPGMDTRQVVARFEAERQALALMDHPNIARVLDAGATSAGRPYFAMELVKGIPIQQYCDDAAALAARAAGALHRRVPRGSARAPKGDHPPRPEALEHPRRPARREGGAEGDRLRHREGDSSAS